MSWVDFTESLHPRGRVAGNGCQMDTRDSDGAKGEAMDPSDDPEAPCYCVRPCDGPCENGWCDNGCYKDGCEHWCSQCCPDVTCCPERCVLCLSVCCWEFCKYELACCKPPPPPPPWMEAFGTPPKPWKYVCGDRVATALYLIYRICLFGASLGVAIWLATEHDSSTHYGQRFFIFLPNWMLIYQVIYLLLASTTTALAVAQKEPCACVVPCCCTTITTPWYAHLAWAMHMTAVVMPIYLVLFDSFLVGDLSNGPQCNMWSGDNDNDDWTDDCCPKLSYWDSECTQQAPQGVSSSTIAVATYLIPRSTQWITLLISLLDWCVHEQYYPVWDMFWPQLLCCIYTVFTLIYQEETGEEEGATPYVVYPELDWSEASNAAMVWFTKFFSMVALIYGIMALLDMLLKKYMLCACLMLPCKICHMCWTSPCCPPAGLEKGEPVDVECQTDGNAMIDPDWEPPSGPDPDEVRAAFEEFDTDGSGSLEVKELQQALARLGVETSSDAARRILDKFDKDGDGTIGLDEFTKLVARIARKREKKERASMREKSMRESARSSRKGSTRGSGSVEEERSLLADEEEPPVAVAEPSRSRRDSRGSNRSRMSSSMV